MNIKRRFIAGARCIRCGKTDTTRSCVSADREWMECVSCGYEEERPTEVTPVEKHEDEEDEGTGVVIFRNS